MIALGGPHHGSLMIATRDVAEMLVGGALYQGKENLFIESGGPKWLTWREVAAIHAGKTGQKKIRLIPMPSWLPRFNQICARPFSPAAANTFGLMSFDFQPKWGSRDAVKKLDLPQLTLSDYLDLNYHPSSA